MFFSIVMVSILKMQKKIKIKPNENAKEYKIGANQTEFQNVYVL
jgi:hypothetical protein